MGCGVSTLHQHATQQPVAAQVALGRSLVTLEPAAEQAPAPKRPASEVGVSLAFLRAFAKKVPPDWNSGRVMKEIIFPESQPFKCRYADSPKLVPPKCVARPTHFVSHCWVNPFSLLLEAVERHLAGSVPEEVFVWVDLFAMNQHSSAEGGGDLGDLMTNLESSVSGTAGTIVVMDETGGPLVRVWCLLEVWTTLKLKGPEALHILTPSGFSLAQVAGAFQEIDIVNRARATVESDKQLILGWIASDNNIPAFDAPGQAVPTQPPDAASSETAASGSTPGGAAGAARIERLNATLRLLFLLDPLDFSAELAAAAAYGEPAQPSTSSAGVKAAGTSTQGLPGWELQPVLEWCSDQGPGKTARLMAVWGALGSGKTTLAAALCKAVGRIKAYHFCKRGDARRQDLVRMVKTLAYQLGTTVPKLQEIYTALDSAEVQALADPEKAFRILLQEPLSKLGTEEGAPAITLIVDGLDEADDERLGGLGNGVLHLLRDGFARLPPSISILVTARPEAHITAALWASFPGQLLRELHVGDLQAKATSSGSNGSTQVQRVASRLAASASLEGGYADEVAAALVSRTSAMESSLMALRLAEELVVQCLMKGTTRGGSASTSSSSQLPSADSLLALLPPSELGVPGLYRALFDHALKGPAAGKEQLLGSILSVLAAAREPLTLAQLQGLGYGSAQLECLPGWGSLYYASEFRVHSLHASLGEWLLHQQAAGSAGGGETGGSATGPPVAVDLTSGHAALATACFEDLASPRLAPGRGKGLLSPYACQYAVMHLCTAAAAPGPTHNSSSTGSSSSSSPGGRTEALKLLEALVLDFDTWEALFAGGYGAAAARDLSQLAPATGCAAAMEVARWLQGCADYLTRNPGAALQLAVEAPVESLVAKAARSYYRAPVACLLHPPQQWPASLQVLKGAYGKPCISDGSLPLIACGLWGGGTALWDASNGRRLLSVHGSRPVPDKKADIRTAAFSPEPAHAQGHIHTQDRDASGGPTAGTAGSQQQQQPHWMVTLGDEGLWLWDVATAQEVASVQQGLHYPSCLAWAPDGQRFACVVSSKTREVVVWSIETPDPSVAAAGGSSSPVAALKEVMRLPHDAHEGHDAVENIGMAAVGWAHGGSILLTCSATDGKVRAWDTATGKPAGPAAAPALPPGISDTSSAGQSTREAVVELQGGKKHMESKHAGFAAEGTLVVCASRFQVHIWSAVTGQELRVLPGHGKDTPIVSVPSPDGLFIATGGWDSVVHVWSTATGALLCKFHGHDRRVDDLTWSADGQRLLTVGVDRTLRVFGSTGPGSPPPWAAALSALDTSSTSSPGQPSVQGAPGTGHQQQQDDPEGSSGGGAEEAQGFVVCEEDPSVDQFDNQPPAVLCAAFCPGQPNLLLLACGMDTGRVRIYDLLKEVAQTKGTAPGPKPFAPKPVAVLVIPDDQSRWSPIFEHEVAWSPTGGLLASVADDRVIRVWLAPGASQASSVPAGTEASGGWRLVHELRQSFVEGLSWSPNGLRLASVDDGILKVYDPASGELLHSLGGDSLLEDAGEEEGEEGEDEEGKEEEGGAGPVAEGMEPVEEGEREGHEEEEGADDQSEEEEEEEGDPTLQVSLLLTNSTQAWSADSTKLVTGSRGGIVWLWDVTSGEPLGTYSGIGTSNVFLALLSPCGTRILAGMQGGMRVWDAESGKRIAKLEGDGGHGGGGTRAVWSQDSKTVLSLNPRSDQHARLWDAATGGQLALIAGAAGGGMAKRQGIPQVLQASGVGSNSSGGGGSTAQQLFACAATDLVSAYGQGDGKQVVLARPAAGGGSKAGHARAWQLFSTVPIQEAWLSQQPADGSSDEPWLAVLASNSGKTLACYELLQQPGIL